MGHSDGVSGEAATRRPVLPVPDLGRMGRQRLARLRRQMQAQDVHGAVLMHAPNVAYATGFVAEPVDASHAVHRRAVAVVSAADGPSRLHAHRPAETPDVGSGSDAGSGSGSDAGSGSDCSALLWPGLDDGAVCADLGSPLWPELDDGAAAFGAAVAEVLGSLAGRRVAVDAVTGAMSRAGVLDGAELVDANRVTGPARVMKTPDELACIDQAQRWTEQAMTAAQAACVPGATRAEVAGVFLAGLRRDDAGGGACRNVIDPILQPMPARRDGGPRTSTGHVAFPTGVDDPVYAEGDLVWVDAGVAYHGYMSDFGRTWVVGRGPSGAERSLFERWRAVLDASLAAVRPGATLGDVGRAARAVEPDETPWLPQFYLAHGTGLESAEMPMVGTDLGLAFDDSYPLEPGMVLVFEPVVWADGVGGHRAEEIVAVTDGGWRPLGGGHHYEPFEP